MFELMDWGHGIIKWIDPCVCGCVCECCGPSDAASLASDNSVKKPDTAAAAKRPVDP